ncbi:MAG TPA: hypothetical protein VNS61_04645 [Caldimonas sp.]|nr:hypothetical protein [Caldimonas sp.]
MSAKPPTRQAPDARPVDDRSAAPASKDKHRSLGWVRDVLGRSIRIEQRRPQQNGASSEPRSKSADSPLSLLMQQRAELGARLLVHDPATQAVRNLFAVHDALRSGGWPGVEALPLKVLGRALTEAEILACDEPAPLMTTIIDNLRELKDAADERLAQEALQREFETLQVPEVSETNYDEYELMERSWMGTVPAGLELPDRGAGPVTR